MVATGGSWFVVARDYAPKGTLPALYNNKAPVIFFGIATKGANGIEKGAVFEILTRAHEM